MRKPKRFYNGPLPYEYCLLYVNSYNEVRPLMLHNCKSAHTALEMAAARGIPTDRIVGGASANQLSIMFAEVVRRERETEDEDEEDSF